MRLLLAFAVAISVEPQMMLIDEILAVGDVASNRIGSSASAISRILE
jgi:ABC-type polysaccharide/polyol phosphate transport system ATPase subunit